MAVIDLDDPIAGTRVSVTFDTEVPRRLDEIIARFTTDFELAKTRTVVKLFTYGLRFISRSEGKRLTRGLERFQEVVVDFEGVTTVGQGFADEVFRVWGAAHPAVALQPVNMSPAVTMMVRRAAP